MLYVSVISFFCISVQCCIYVLAGNRLPGTYTYMYTVWENDGTYMYIVHVHVWNCSLHITGSYTCVHTLNVCLYRNSAHVGIGKVLKYYQLHRRTSAKETAFHVHVHVLQCTCTCIHVCIYTCTCIQCIYVHVHVCTECGHVSKLTLCVVTDILTKLCGAYMYMYILYGGWLRHSALENVLKSFAPTKLMII